MIEWLDVSGIRASAEALVVAYRSYADASKSGGELDTLTVGACYAPKSAWQAFDDRIERAWRGFGLDALHMRTLPAWKTAAERAAVMKLAIDLMEEHFILPFSTSIYLGDYNAVNDMFRLREELGRPYALAAYDVMETVQWWTDTRDHGRVVTSLDHVFERGDEGIGDLDALVDRHGRKHAIGFKSKSYKSTCGRRYYIRPFETADLVAWEMRRHYEFKLRSLTQPRVSWNRLIDPTAELRHRVGTRESLQGLCVKLGVSRRAGSGTTPADGVPSPSDAG